MLFVSSIQAALLSAVAAFVEPETEAAQPDEFAQPQPEGSETELPRARACSASSEASPTRRQWATV